MQCNEFNRVNHVKCSALHVSALVAIVRGMTLTGSYLKLFRVMTRSEAGLYEYSLMSICASGYTCAVCTLEGRVEFCTLACTCWVPGDKVCTRKAHLSQDWGHKQPETPAPVFHFIIVRSLPDTKHLFSLACPKHNTSQNCSLCFSYEWKWIIFFGRCVLRFKSS
jgi:hypothetical protein